MSRLIVQNALQTPYVLLEHGIDSLDTNVYTLGLFLEQTECRDKMFKVLQYACKAVALLLTRFFPSLKSVHDIHARLLLLDTHTGICRKYLRTFAFLPLWRFALLVWRSDDSTWLKLGALGRLLGMSGYFFFDNLCLAIKLRILDGWDMAPFFRLSLLFQLVNQCASFGVNLHHLSGVNLECDIVTKRLRDGDKNDQRTSGKRKGEKSSSRRAERRTGHRRDSTGDDENVELSFADKQTLIEQIDVLNRKRNDLHFQLLKNISEGTLAANVVLRLGLPEMFTVFLDLANAYLSTKEVFLRLKAKARAEKAEKERSAETISRVSALYARGHFGKLMQRSLSVPVNPRLVCKTP